MQRRSVLVISPTPPLPRDYGNRNRVFQTISFFKQLQFDVSLLLYPFDDDWVKRIPPYYRELVDMCDYFAVVPNSRRLHQAALGDHHDIDEWWDENIGRQLEWLFARKKFNVLFVNYTFFSKAFEYAPPGVLGMLDTHDIFSGRREIFEGYGVEPEFFYTTAEQEAVAFNRAGCVIAIKPSEERFIRTLTGKAVVSLTYWDATVGADAPQRDENVKFSHERPLILGFIGALNSVNSVNMTRFLTMFERYVLLYDLPVQVVVAGNVCKRLPDFPFLKKLGRIPSVDDFYRSIDAVIAPLEFSTGIKIKVGEALAWGLPVLATHNAFDGFKSYHFTQSQPSVAAVCASIADIATNQITMRHLRAAAGRAAMAAAKAQERGFERMRTFISENTRRIVVFTTRPFWYRGTFLDEQIAQMIEYLSAIERVVVFVDHAETPNVDALHCDVDWEQAGPGEMSAILAEMSVHSRIVGFIQCDGGDGMIDGDAIALAANCWILRFAPSRGDGRFAAPRLVAMKGARNTVDLPVSTCRYLPLRAQQRKNPRRVAIYAPQAPSEWEQIALDCARVLCAERKLDFAEKRIPDYFEYQASFFDAVTDDPAERSILIGPRGWEFAVAQISEYRDGATMLVSEDYIVPEKIDRSGRPSLVDAMTQFLDEGGSAALFGGPNSGWGSVWEVLAARNDLG